MQRLSERSTRAKTAKPKLIGKMVHAAMYINSSVFVFVKALNIFELMSCKCKSKHAVALLHVALYSALVIYIVVFLQRTVNTSSDETLG